MRFGVLGTGTNYRFFEFAGRVWVSGTKAPTIVSLSLQAGQIEMDVT